MAGMGPVPKPEAEQRRPGRNLATHATRLPAAGRSGDPPPWPLTGRPLKSEMHLWAELWRTPQSVAWEQLGWERTVARYARQLVKAERRDAPVTTLAEVRQLEDRLGLSPMSMLRLRWEIEPAPAEQTAPTDGKVASLEDRRQRLAGG